MNEVAMACLQQALAAMAAHEPLAAEHWVKAARLAAPNDLRVHNLIEEQRLPGNFSEWMGVNAVVSPDDDIFRFFANHPTSVNPMRDYLADGWRTAVELQKVLTGQGLHLGTCRSFLEFACGHGRFTRHLVQLLPHGALAVSDVVPGTVDFLKDLFKVEGFYSSTEPAQIEGAQQYEVVFVLSLFSHLPPSRWHGWLHRLFDMLAPAGVLIISTHGARCAQLVGIELAEQPFVFIPESESTVLDGAEYGCTYVPLSSFTTEVAQVLGAGARVDALPAVFWGNQDAIIVSRR